MKYLAIIFSVFLFLSCTNAQQIDKITRRCPSPNTNVYSSVLITRNGDVTHLPCPSRSSIFTGNVDFSGATLTGVVSGTGTFDFIPRWSGASTLTNTPLSWNGDQYFWENTALNSTFNMRLRPNGALDGSFRVGDTNDFLQIEDASGAIDLQAVASVRVKSSFIEILNSDSNTLGRFQDIGLSGSVVLGDASAQGNNSTITIDDSTNTGQISVNNGNLQFTMSGSGNDFQFGGTDAIFNAEIIELATIGDCNITPRVCFTLNQTAQLASLTTTSAAGFAANGSADTSSVGDISSSANLSLFTVNDSLKSFAFTTSANDGLFNLAGVQNYQYQRTITAGGTTGAQTINKPSGTVNFAGGASSLVVTNSTVTTTSIVYAIARTNDATCVIKNVVPAAGSFTINMTAACTAETSVGFLVTN